MTQLRTTPASSAISKPSFRLSLISASAGGENPVHRHHSGTRHWGGGFLPDRLSGVLGSPHGRRLIVDVEASPCGPPVEQTALHTIVCRHHRACRFNKMLLAQTVICRSMRISNKPRSVVPRGLDRR